jgi:nucleotide-binding universal stress UspA family protein
MAPTTVWRQAREKARRSLVNALATIDHPRTEEGVAPIVAAVDGSAASRAAVDEAVRLAGELEAPLVFVHVRRGPGDFLGTPLYEKRLAVKTARARRVLDEAVAVADRAGVPADSEVLEGSPQQRLAEFARDRGARLIVVGSRRHKLGQGVSTGVIRAAGRPVIVTQSVPLVSSVA